jgi:hypothetical protein
MDLYDALGQQHRELLEIVRRQFPDAKDEKLALHALRLISPEICDRVAGRGANGLREWVDEHRGEWPRVRNRDAIYGFSGEEQVCMDYRWIGLAVIVAVVAGAFIAVARSRAEERREDRPTPTPTPTPPPSRPQPRGPSVRVAVAVPCSKLREVGTGPNASADLLTRATYWWTGTSGTWERVVDDLGLAEVSGELGDDDMVLLVFDVRNHVGPALSSRPEAASVLRERSARSDVVVVGKFGMAAPQSLSAAGFRR